MLDFTNGPVAIRLLGAGANFSKYGGTVDPAVLGYFGFSRAGSAASQQYASGNLHAVPRLVDEGHHIALTSPTWLREMAVSGPGILGFGGYPGSNGDQVPYTPCGHSSAFATRPGGKRSRYRFFWARSFLPPGSSRRPRLFHSPRHRSTEDSDQVAVSPRVRAYRNSRSFSVMWKNTFVPLHQGAERYSRERRY
ncbi:hypothetical protein GGD50_005998 [Rhizobium paranaense]|uniref:Uncharacterized protein n=1 Tax=Rhizobium paranaense TaxID=1650438 RepID=A0A7W8XXG5_9HYPH|nr:hypothetical protein [Rhizobium paranaense]